MKQFNIQAKLKCYYYVEDSKCPSYWRGSGVYDREVSCEQDVTCTVWADDEAMAKDMTEDYVNSHEFDKWNPYIIIVEEVVFESVTVTGEDDCDEGVEVKYGKCKDY